MQIPEFIDDPDNGDTNHEQGAVVQMALRKSAKPKDDHTPEPEDDGAKA